MVSKGDMFTEIRKLRRSSHTVVNAIDGVTEDLPNHFAKIYNTLYNSVNDRDSLSSLYQSINEKTCVAGIDDAMKVTSTIIREAVNHLKSNKNDSTFLFTSGCLKNAPAILYEQLALVFRFYIIHGHVSNILMLSTLTVDYFMRNDSNVYVCVMDMKKAFDTVQHSVLF